MGKTLGGTWYKSRGRARKAAERKMSYTRDWRDRKLPLPLGLEEPKREVSEPSGTTMTDTREGAAAIQRNH